MKLYENANASVLVPRMPILIRVDGRSFHTFTKQFNRPFDPIITNAMDRTMEALMQECQGSVLGYVQSDEISILLQTDARPETQAWFGGKVQKICSIAAAVATASFNIELARTAGVPADATGFGTHRLFAAHFDARCWNMPWADVANYFLWRYKDATRNSVSAYARSMFSHKELNKKSVLEMKEMIESRVTGWGDEVYIECENPHDDKPSWPELPSRDRQGLFTTSDRVFNNNFSLNVFKEVDYAMVNDVINVVRDNLRK